MAEQQYGSWLRGDASLEDVFLNIRKMCPSSLLASDDVTIKVTRRSECYSEIEGEMIKQDGFTAWKVTGYVD